MFSTAIRDYCDAYLNMGLSSSGSRIFAMNPLRKLRLYSATTDRVPDILRSSAESAVGFAMEPAATDALPCVGKCAAALVSVVLFK
jgi:hypothetical protein